MYPTITPLNLQGLHMPFTYEPITPADSERMEALNIMLRWNKPQAYNWSVNRETGDFLVHIFQDREPPHWQWFALWWNGMLYCIAIEEKDHPNSPVGENVGLEINYL